MTSEEARSAILGFLLRQAEPVRSRDIVAATGVPYSQVYNLCNRLAYDRLVEKVGADQLARWVEHDGRQVRLSVESSAIGWRIKPPPATERQVAALAESWAQPAVEPVRIVEPTPADAVGKMTRLMARLRGVAALVESPTVATELERIAAGLGDVRDDLVALIVDPPKPYQDTENQEPPRPDYRRNRTAREKNPEPGKRRCSGPCGRLLPVEQFTVTDRRTGKRQILLRSSSSVRSATGAAGPVSSRSASRTLPGVRSRQMTIRQASATAPAMSPEATLSAVTPDRQRKPATSMATTAATATTRTRRLACPVTT